MFCLFVCFFNPVKLYLPQVLLGLFTAIIYLEKRLNSDTRVVGTFNFVCQDPIFGNKRIRKHFDKQINVASKYIYKQDEKNQFSICYGHILD